MSLDSRVKEMIEWQEHNQEELYRKVSNMVTDTRDENEIFTSEDRLDLNKMMRDVEEKMCGNPVREACEKIYHEAVLKDSGERRQFESGAVRDIQRGKGRCDLLPLDVVAAFYHEIDPDCPANTVLFYIDEFKTTGYVQWLYSVLRFTPFGNNFANMFLELAIHFEDGAVKYGENNWQKGIPVNCYIDSAVRHYLKFLRGDKDEPHDRAFVWNIICAIWTCIHKPELNPYRKKDE